MKKIITRITVCLRTISHSSVVQVLDFLITISKIFKHSYLSPLTIKYLFVAFVFVLTSIAQLHTVAAHSGRLAKDGCHNDKKSGTRHCHQDNISNTKLKTKSNSAYKRDEYGGWIDADNDGQNTRQEVLIEENIGTLVFSPNGKKVISGKWYDPYTNQIFTNPSDLDIDHFVPLKEAHISGARHWSREKKREYANYLHDEQHLIAVSKSANRSKGSRDPSQYLPPHKEYICHYVTTWIAIKEKWKLNIDEREKKAIEVATQDNQCK